MSREDDKYFEWLCHLIDEKKIVRGKTYRRLLMHLHSVDFEYLIPMDANRASDGLDLRYRYVRENMVELEDRPCTVLEMMVALCVRVEENIMEDDEYGDRTYVWFWSMIENLGLMHMTDDIYDRKYVDTVIDCLLTRNYEKDGQGGLFTVNTRPDANMRKTEIWYQMMWWLCEKFGYR